MKYNFPDIQEDEELLLLLSSGNKEMEMNAKLVKFIKEEIAVIDIETPNSQVLNFDNVIVHTVYTNENGTPYIWRNCKIVYYKGKYVLQVFGEGNRFNRRNSFRVGISKPARMRAAGRGEETVLVRDISLTGFGITISKGCKDLSAYVTYKQRQHRGH